MREAVKNAALIGAAVGVLLTSAPAEAKKAELSSFEKEQAYVEQLESELKARTGKDQVLPDLKDVPEAAADAAAKPAPALKFGVVPKETFEVPEAVPEPAPAVKAEVPMVVSSQLAPIPETKPAVEEAATKAAAPVPAAAAPAVAPAAGPTGNTGVLIGGAVAVVALAAVAAAGGVQAEAGAVAGAAPAAASAVSAASDAPANVQEARAWIAAWKAKHGKN